jgi:hypothetical protein
MFTLQTSFKPLLLKGGGGGMEENPFVELTVHSKEMAGELVLPRKDRIVCTTWNRQNILYSTAERQDRLYVHCKA